MPNAHPPREIGRTDGNRAFRYAARHSRHVRFLRIAIPAVIVIVAAVILFATFFNPLRLLPIPIDPGEVIWSGTKIMMKLPRVKGFTSDQRPYELTARAAVQNLTTMDVLELEELSGNVELRDGQHVTIKSANGVYDTKAEVLRLNDHITVSSTSGYEGRLSEATVHIASGNIVSESPVEVKLPNGVLSANRLEVKENGAVIKFGGGVEMNLTPEQLRPADHQDSQLVRSDSPLVRQDAVPPASAAAMQTSQRRGAMSP